MVLEYFLFVQSTKVVRVFLFQGLKHGIFFVMKLNNKHMQAASKNQFKNWGHKIAHVHCAKFILIVPDSFFNYQKCTGFCVFIIFLFHPTDIDLFILIWEMMLLWRPSTCKSLLDTLKIFNRIVFSRRVYLLT